MANVYNLLTFDEFISWICRKAVTKVHNVIYSRKFVDRLADTASSKNILLSYAQGDLKRNMENAKWARNDDGLIFVSYKEP